MPTAVASAVAPRLPQVHQQHDISPKSSYPTLAPSSHAPSVSAERRSPTGGSTNGQRAPSDGHSPNHQRGEPPHSQTPSQQQPPPPAPPSQAPSQQQQPPAQNPSPDGKRTSPQSTRSGGHPPKIIVKKEPPASPEQPVTARHRPRKLDLTSSTASSMAATAGRPAGGPMTARDPGSLGMHDVGLACLSPGFQTHDPSMREQLQKSISVRNQQQHIIESRLQRTVGGKGGPGGPDTGASGDRPDSGATFGGGLKTPMTSKKRPPPAGLSIVPPSAEQFANERVIQSAPLHASFPRHHQPPHSRHTAHGPGAAHAPGQSSHLHHVPAMQTANRLPPITDVFAGEGLGISGGNGSAGRDAPSTGGGQTSGGPGSGAPTRPGFYHSNSASSLSHANHRAGFPSPGLPPPSSHHGPPGREPPHPSASAGPPSREYPPPPHLNGGPPPQQHPHHPQQPPPQQHPSQQAPGSGRPPQREYRSAEEAVADMASGREDLLPKIVHYGGHQPPTPPSPPPGARGEHAHLVAVHGGGGTDRTSTTSGSAAPPHHHHHHHHHHHAPSGLTPNKQAIAAGSAPTPGSGGGNGGGGGGSGGALERSASGARRRGRLEYERDNGSPPLGSGPSPRARPGPFGEGRDSPETQRRKKDEFLSLCSRAWELFHS